MLEFLSWDRRALLLFFFIKSKEDNIETRSSQDIRKTGYKKLVRNRCIKKGFDAFLTGTGFFERKCRPNGSIN